jgi:hypothetical protein
MQETRLNGGFFCFYCHHPPLDALVPALPISWKETLQQ